MLGSDEHPLLKVGWMYATDHSGEKKSAARKVLNIDASGEDRKKQAFYKIPA